MPPSPKDLARLAYKYETLAELRRARAAGASIPPKAIFKALADEFPGALNELDMLPLEIIDERAAALGRAARGGRGEPWMEWLLAYHALMRAALRVKLRLARARVVSDARAQSLAADASAIAGTPVDAELVRAIARPPAGRITPLVYARLGRTFGVAPNEIADALFPRRRALRRPP